MLTKVVLTLLVLLTLLFTACSPPIAGDAGTYAEPTPNVWGETVEQDLEQVDAARATREAR